MRRIMDEGRVLLVNLAKGRIGEDSSSLLGGMLVTTIGLAGYSRADIDPDQPPRLLRLCRRVPELHDAGACEHALGNAQVPGRIHRRPPIPAPAHRDIRHAVLGNAGTLISFRVGAEDAPYLAREFHEAFEEIDFCSCRTTTSI